MNEMMEGWSAERKNGMVQSEPVAVILPPPLNGSSWTSVSATRLYCCQSALLGIMQQGEELDAAQMDGYVDGGIWLGGAFR